MTVHGSGGEILAPQRSSGVAAAGARGESPLSVAAILTLCDRHIGEAGRRAHLFAWLRIPGADADQWLAVEAYYPVNRIVVVCGAEPKHQGLYRELVPARGLRLLELDPSSLPARRDAAEVALARVIAALGPAPEPVRGPARPGRAVAGREASQSRAAPAPQRRRVGQSQAAAAERAARFVAAHPVAGRPIRQSAGAARKPLPAPAARPLPRSAPPVRPLPRSAPLARPLPRSAPQDGPPTAGDAQTLGVTLGLTLIIAAFAEVFVGVTEIGIDKGRVLLAFALAMDTAARTLGTIAAARAGERDWAWACALGGSPLVAAFALLQPDGPVRVDPAPLAGLLSVLAGFGLFVALLVALAGG